MTEKTLARTATVATSPPNKPTSSTFSPWAKEDEGVMAARKQTANKATRMDIEKLRVLLIEHPKYRTANS